jgi:hypothetical protein
MSIQGYALMQLQLTYLRQKILIPIFIGHTQSGLTVRLIRAPIKPISIEGLPSDPNIPPPKLGKLRARLKTKRIGKGIWDRQKRKYGNWKQTGHNTRRYRPACRKKKKGGDGEKARDGQLLIMVTLVNPRSHS